MPIQRLNRTWVDGELWDAADDANPIGQKIDEVVDKTNELIYLVPIVTGKQIGRAHV